MSRFFYGISHLYRSGNQRLIITSRKGRLVTESGNRTVKSALVNPPFTDCV